MITIKNTYNNNVINISYEYPMYARNCAINISYRVPLNNSNFSESQIMAFILFLRVSRERTPGKKNIEARDRTWGISNIIAQRHKPVLGNDNEKRNSKMI